MRLDTNQIHLIPINPAIVHWVDLDRDGNLDLIAIGADETQTVMLRAYLNNSNHILTPGITWQSEILVLLLVQLLLLIIMETDTKILLFQD